ncbi:protein HGH1 [Biomphalaria glabrata]|uniref:Protein HGH1 homolog n=1 Tax=Biomphalaria glabrata TaxID=6526 RepID=A0A2C9K4Z3_BIOGL|nr:protein HGH1 [Biomphalaria glabrata]
MALDQTTKLLLEKEMLPFLTPSARPDVKSIAVRYFLEMTGSKEGRDFIAEGNTFIPAIISLTTDTQLDAAKDAFLTLINLSSEDTISWKLMHNDVTSTFIMDLLQKILQPDFKFADEACSIVSNVTRIPSCAKHLAEQVLADNSKVTIEKIVSVLCQINYNKHAALHYLGLILSNLTQVSEIRKIIMDKEKRIIQKLLPFTEYADSLTRRGGIIGTLKNCCFEYDYHQWLLSEDVDLLTRLLLPLAGGEELDEDDMDKLPIDLQYLPPDKKRELDPDLRTMLIESIMQLCSTKCGRLFIKEKNAYVILRELHKWEKDPKAKLACQNLCELLISDEPEQGMEDLHQVEVPAHLQQKFNELDLALLKTFEEEDKDKDNSNDCQQSIK